jgi:hypothetical protein
MLQSEIQLRIMQLLYFVCGIWCGSMFNSVGSRCSLLKVVRKCCRDRSKANNLVYRSVSPGRRVKS